MLQCTTEVATHSQDLLTHFPIALGPNLLPARRKDCPQVVQAHYMAHYMHITWRITCTLHSHIHGSCITYITDGLSKTPLTLRHEEMRERKSKALGLVTYESPGALPWKLTWQL